MEITKRAAHRRNNSEDGITYECDISVPNWYMKDMNYQSDANKSPVVRTLRSHCQGQDWIPGGETKIPQALRPKEKKKDNNEAKEVKVPYNLRALTLDYLGLSILTAPLTM